MVVKRKITKTYEVEFWPKEAWTASTKDLLGVSSRSDLTARGLDRCFCCGRKFGEDEIPRAGTVYGVGNRFFCDSCVNLAEETEESE